MSYIINSSLIVFIAAVLLGVLVHDLNLDKATKLAFAPPAAVAFTGAANAVVARSEHTHVERGSAVKTTNLYNSSLPKVNPPRDDDKRYIQSKKHLFVSGGNDRSALWPSV